MPVADRPGSCAAQRRVRASRRRAPAAVLTAGLTALLAVGLAGCSPSGPAAGSTPASTAQGSTQAGSSAPSTQASSPGSSSPSASSGATPSSGAPSSPGASGAPSSSGEPTASGSGDDLDARAADLVKHMSRAERAGQALMMGEQLDQPTAAWASLLRTEHIGNVFLAGRSSAGTQAIAARTSSLRSAATVRGLKPWLATDQEGGAVQTLKGPGFSTIPRATAQGTLSPAALRKDSATWGSQLRAAGLNMNLAPVADTVPAGTAARNPPIGVFGRQYGSTPDAVLTHSRAFAQGQRDAGVTPVLKHFPGLGAVRGNTDTMANVTDTTTTADGARITAFSRQFTGPSDWVLMSSATYTRIDAQHPAMFSHAVMTELLRGELKFTGVVMSDDLCSAKAVASVPLVTRAQRFIEAGGDVVLCAGGVSTSTARSMVRGMAQLAASDHDFDAALTQAATRVVRSKLAS